MKRGHEWSRPWKQQALSLQETGASDYVTGTWANENKETNLDTDQGGSQRVLWGCWASSPVEAHWVLSRGLSQLDMHFFKHHDRCSEEDGRGPAWVWLMQDWWWWRVTCLGRGTDTRDGKGTNLWLLRKWKYSKHLLWPQQHGTRNQPQERKWEKMITWRLTNILLQNQWVNEEIKKVIKKLPWDKQQWRHTTQNLGMQ